MANQKPIPLLPDVVGRFFERKRIGANENVLVALSGGNDSVGLLLACVRYFGAKRVWAAHFDHGLRGKESDEDRLFCQELCQKLGVNLSIGHGDVLGEAQIRKTGMEDSARVLRYQFLLETAKSLEIRYVLTGHTLDDQAETVLLNFIRWSKLSGLSGIPDSDSRGILRPLLTVQKSEIVDYLTSENQSCRFDSSNADPSFVRNRLRISIIPEIESINPGFSKTLSRFAEYAHELDSHLENEVSEYLAAQERPRSFNLSEFGELSDFFQKEVLSRLYVWANGNSIGLSMGMVLEMSRFCSVRYGGKSKTFGMLQLERRKWCIRYEKISKA